MPHAYSYFRIIGDDLPLDEITQALGLEPTESWKKGDAGKYVEARRDSGWCLKSPLPQSNTCLFEHIEAVLTLLKPRAKEIKCLSDKYETYLVCTGHYDDTCSPGLFLSKENVSLMASMGLALDADLYFG